MLFRDKTRLCLQHRTHDFLTKLAYIARPRMGQQCLAGFSVKADDIAFQFPVRSFTEELSQRHDVLLTVAQRRDGYLEVMQAV